MNLPIRDRDSQRKDAAGESYISGRDLGVAFLDEIENPTHHRENFAVGY